MINKHRDNISNVMIFLGCKTPSIPFIKYLELSNNILYANNSFVKETV